MFVSTKNETITSHQKLTVMNYARNTYNEMKAQVANVNAMINSINADEIAEMRNSGEENWTIAQRASVFSLLPADSITKIERLGKMIGLNVHQMITFLQVKHYDFKYFSHKI